MTNCSLSGFKNGFAIGYEGLDFPLITDNLPSARDNPEQVTTAIIKELERDHTADHLFYHLLRTFGVPPLGLSSRKMSLIA